MITKQTNPSFFSRYLYLSFCCLKAMPNNLYYARSVAVSANALFAGLGITLNLVTVPVLRACGYNPQGWAVTYSQGAKLGVSTIVLSTAGHLYVYYKTGNMRALYCGILSAVSFPYTLFFMKPTNDRLQTMAKQLSHEKQEAAALIERWDTLQWFRTVAGSVAFILAVW